MANSGNLRPFPPGTSGNPAGRPKGALGLTGRLREKLRVDDGAHADAVVESLITQACSGGPGSTKLAKLIFDRVDGPTVAAVRIEAAHDATADVLAVAREVLPAAKCEALQAALAAR